MVACVAKKQKDQTTLKAHRPLAEKIGQLASMLGKTIPEVLDKYEKNIEDDLLEVIAKRKAEIEKSRQRSG